MTERINRAIPLVFLAILLSVVIMACTADASPGVIVQGFVFDRNHQIVANATVTLYIDEVPLATSSNPALTNTNGYYAFWGIDSGLYCLVASKDAYSLSNTIIVQDWDVMQNLTLPASTTDLYPTPVPTPSPIPSVTATPTAGPAASATPMPVASSGFELLLWLSGAGMAAMLLMRDRKRHA